MYVCMYTPEAIKTSGMILALYDWFNNSGCFSVRFITLAVDVIDRRGPTVVTKCVTSYSQRRLRSGCIIRLYNSKRRFSPLLLLKRRSTLVLKVGVSYRWQSI